MRVQRARLVYWKKVAAKHELEELKGEAWIEPAPAFLRKKTKGVLIWTENHRNVAREVFLEGGWTQKRLFDIGWSDASECQAYHKEEGTAKHRLTTAQNGTKSDEGFQMLSESGSKKREHPRRCGSGKEVLLHILSVKANGTGTTSA